MNKSLILIGLGSALTFVSLILIGLGVGAVISLPILVVGALLAAGGGAMASRAQRKFMWRLQTRVGNLETRTQKVQEQFEKVQEQFEQVRKIAEEAREFAAQSTQEDLSLIEGQVQQHETQLREVGRLISSGRAGETFRQG